jgi:transcriptional regulator with XRE-family HTH domain
MDVETLSRQLIRALRGRRSQTAIGRRLGFDGGTYYSWESGRRFPKATTFFDLANKSGIPVHEKLQRFLDDSAAATGGSWSKDDTTQFLRKLASNATAIEIASKLGVNRATVSRWLLGSTEPSLPHLLSLVGLTSQRLLQFAGIFANPEQLPVLQRAQRDLLAQERLAYEQPWSHAVLRALELDAYRRLAAHRPGLIATAIGISAAEEERYLDELAAARQIKWKNGRWVVARVLNLDTRRDRKRNRALKLHWSMVGSERLQRSPENSRGFYSYNLFAVSQPAFERIRELHFEYYEQMRAVIAESKGADRVILSNLQLIPLDE